MSGKRRYSYIVVHGFNTFAVDIVNMINFLIDNIFMEIEVRISKHTVGIPMGTNSFPIFSDLFLHSYEATVVQETLRIGEKKLSQSFNYQSVI